MKDFLLAMVAVILAATPKSAASQYWQSRSMKSPSRTGWEQLNLWRMKATYLTWCPLCLWEVCLHPGRKHNTKSSVLTWTWTRILSILQLDSLGQTQYLGSDSLKGATLCNVDFAAHLTFPLPLRSRHLWWAALLTVELSLHEFVRKRQMWFWKKKTSQLKTVSSGFASDFDSWLRCDSISSFDNFSRRGLWWHPAARAEETGSACCVEPSRDNEAELWPPGCRGLHVCGWAVNCAIF